MNEQSRQYLKTVINDRRDLIHQVAKLKLENSKLQEQLIIHGVVFNEAIENKITITLELNKPVTSKLSDWTDKSEVELCNCKEPKTSKWALASFDEKICEDCDKPIA
jgi:hypothetical protein